MVACLRHACTRASSAYPTRHSLRSFRVGLLKYRVFDTRRGVGQCPARLMTIAVVLHTEGHNYPTQRENVGNRQIVKRASQFHQLDHCEGWTLSRFLGCALYNVDEMIEILELYEKETGFQFIKSSFFKWKITH